MCCDAAVHFRNTWGKCPQGECPQENVAYQEKRHPTADIADPPAIYVDKEPCAQGEDGPEAREKPATSSADCEIRFVRQGRPNGLERCLKSQNVSFEGGDRLGQVFADARNNCRQDLGIDNGRDSRKLVARG